MRIAVIGAGPMGIAAALGAIERGWDVVVLERDAVGASLRTWGPTRFFSPLHMNVSTSMRRILGQDSPDGDALLTGPEYVERVLLPLADREPLRGRVRTGVNVVAIGRRGLARTDYAGHPLRAERPFRIVAGNDETFEADAVLDASGGMIVPRAFGPGGLPAAGEQRLRDRVIRTLGALSEARDALRGRSVLLVGAGHSAANAIAMLEELSREGEGVRVVWAVRTANRRPCVEVPDDPLPERARIVERANVLAATPPGFLRVERRAMVERVDDRDGRLSVTLTGNRIVEVDRIAAFTGYRPDASFLSELTVEISPVSEGGARLYRAVSCITDCLSVPAVRSEDLQSGEPGFFFVGSRAYGRAPGFLLRTGFAQLETILDSIAALTLRPAS